MVSIVYSLSWVEHIFFPSTHMSVSVVCCGKLLSSDTESNDMVTAHNTRERVLQYENIDRSISDHHLR